MKNNSFQLTSKLSFLLFLFCGVFSINGLPINPVYLVGFPLLFLSLFYVDLSKINQYQLVMLFYFVVTAIGFSIGILNFSKIDNDLIILSSVLYCYCILLGAQTVSLGLITKKIDRLKVYSQFYNFLIFFMFLDLIVRVVMSGGSGTFYDFKWGYFYLDSNFSALIILLFVMFSIFLKVNRIYDIGAIRFLMLLFLLLTTFSRAAIFAFVISYILLRYSKKIIIYLTAIFGTLFIYIFYKMVSIYLSGESFVGIDGSFNSKFYLISVAVDNYADLPLVIKVFGIGMANFPYFSDGIFAHNMLITLFYEFGYFGILFFLIYIFLSYKMIGKDILYILIPFFIAGFSLFSAFMPFFFILLACMYIEKNQSVG